MSMESSQAPQPKRKHVTTACIACRESKVKCDGARPVCRKCTSKGKQCRYQVGEDKRKLSLRVAIELLSSRVNQLSQFIQCNDLQCPPMPSHEEKALKKVLDTLDLTHFNTFAECNTESNSQNQVLTPRSIPSSLDISLDRNETLRASSIPPGAVQNPPSEGISRSAGDGVSSIIPDQGINSLTFATETRKANGLLSREIPGWNTAYEDAAFFDDAILLDPYGLELVQMSTSNEDPRTEPPSTSLESLSGGHSHPSQNESHRQGTNKGEDLIDQLSDRMGSVHIHGKQVRYYGPTSNFNLLAEMPEPDNLTIHRTARVDGPKSLELLGLNKPVPSNVEDHLINLYFAWQDPTFHVVDQEMYDEAKIAWHDRLEDTPYYSEALKNAICCLGAAFEPRYYPSFVTFPKSLSDFFADRAKALIEIELDCPTVATVQAMVVLSAHDIGCKRDARGWLYSGMALRLAFDLALHVDMTPYIKSGAISAEEAELRRTVFWGAYTVDFCWGYYLGRSFRINMEDVTLQKSNFLRVGVRHREWKPYISSAAPCQSITDYPEEISRQRVLLCEIMAPLGHALYGSSSTLKSMLSDISSINARTTSELIYWKSNLPAFLQVDLQDLETQYLPHVLLLHMQYHQYIIYAYRPWMSKTNIDLHGSSGHNFAHARKMCFESAIAVAKLLQMYEMQYTLKRMNIQGVVITCSAACLLTFAQISQNHEIAHQDLAMHLSICFRALDEFSPSWESAKRAKEFLLRLQKEWENATPEPDSVAHSSRPNFKHSKARSSESASRKRSRPIQEHESNILGAFGMSSPLGVSSAKDGNLALDLDWVFTNNSQTISGAWDPRTPSFPSGLFTDSPGSRLQ